MQFPINTAFQPNFNSNKIANDSITIIFAADMSLTLSHIRFAVNEKVYTRDPDSSDLGRTMIKEGIGLIHEIGFDAFTFKKLGAKIGSPESTVYRYFENKHKFLLYLTSWYWSWLEYRLVMQTTNVDDAETRLTKAVSLLTEAVEEDGNFSHINEIKLNQIVVSESIKAFHTRKIGAENKQGCFEGYTNLINRAASMISAVAPNYKYPKMLASTIIESAHQQMFFAEHLPSLTGVHNGNQSITDFFQNMVLAIIKENR